MDAAAENTDKNNFERTGRTLNKPLIFELMLRGGGIVSCTENYARMQLS
jgi:hypothetical protein